MANSRSATRIPENFPTPPLTRDLQALARSRDGVRNEVLLGLDHISALEVVAAQVVEGRTLSQAVTTALWAAIQRLDSRQDQEALAVLLGLRDRHLRPAARARAAAETVGYSVDAFQRSRRRNERWVKSVEVRLLEDLGEVLEGLHRGMEVRGGEEPRRVLGEDAAASAPTDTATDVLGTWRGVLITDWVDPNTGESPPLITSFLVFTRDGDRLAVHHYVETGESMMLTRELVETPEANRRLLGIYEARVPLPRIYLDPPHRGAMVLDIYGRPAKRLRGVYWTDRRTTGTLDYSEWSPEPARDYARALRLDYEQRGS